ncbi:MAG TPA: folate-binding protein [Rhodanobacteraceae bacterium]
MPPRPLFKVQCIEITGADAQHFAQAQFSGDVDALAPNRWQWNAWLDAQGRVKALMHLARMDDDRLLAVLRGGDAEALRSDLARFVLRSKVVLTARSFMGYTSDALGMGESSYEAQCIALGFGDRSLRLATESGEPDPEAANAWCLSDIRAGWPTLPTHATHFLPPALGLERLGAVSFAKGCYPGQEIAARLHYRGGHKYRLCWVRSPAPLRPSGPDQPGKNPSPWILISARDGDGWEALVVQSISDASTINEIAAQIRVVSMFEA